VIESPSATERLPFAVAAPRVVLIVPTYVADPGDTRVNVTLSAVGSLVDATETVVVLLPMLESTTVMVIGDEQP
jgi:hypothetical protein